jgi:hypothetical protein
LRGGRVNKSGKLIEAPGNSYSLIQPAAA